MTDRNQPLDRWFRPPEPPAELRQPVLAAAREAMSQTEGPEIWMRIWGSRPVHLAWAVSVAVLIYGHLLIGGAMPAGSDGPVFPLAAVAGNDDELAEIVGLQRVTVDLPGWELGSRDAIPHAAQSTENEDRS